MTEEQDTDFKIIAQFVTEEGVDVGPRVHLSQGATPEQLTDLINELLQNEDELPYSFRVDAQEIAVTLAETLKSINHSPEDVAKITFLPQAVFRVRAVTRCTASMPGHTEAVLSVTFSPCGTKLASGSGDTTVRLWDLNTQTCDYVCEGHKNWVLAVSFSPCGKYLASGSMDNDVRIWDPSKGTNLKHMKGHTKYISALVWEPLHLTTGSFPCKLASASKDGTVRIWDVVNGKTILSLSGHTSSVTCLRWSGDNLIITGSQDRIIKVFTADGKLIRNLEGHGHWVNTMALNTDYVLRTGAYDHTGQEYGSLEEAREKARERWLQVKGNGPERLVSGSDDFTIFVWEPSAGRKPVCRLTGHQQPINLLSFSPDGRMFASASFDKSLKVWDILSTKHLATLRGHVGAVYQVSWSSDSRMLVSGSKDSTIKLWDLKTKKIKTDLPGHADEVFAVDWSPDGQCVASGSKDRLLKIWKA